MIASFDAVEHRQREYSVNEGEGEPVTATLEREREEDQRGDQCGDEHHIINDKSAREHQQSVKDGATKLRQINRQWSKVSKVHPHTVHSADNRQQQGKTNKQ